VTGAADRGTWGFMVNDRQDVLFGRAALNSLRRALMSVPAYLLLEHLNSPTLTSGDWRVPSVVCACRAT